jgi:hypothetical protein
MTDEENKFGGKETHFLIRPAHEEKSGIGLVAKE